MTEAPEDYTGSDQLNPISRSNLPPWSTTDIAGPQFSTNSSTAASHRHPTSRTAESVWEHRILQAPFSAHENADIARWAV